MGDFDNIKSRIHQGGHEKESSWPSQFGTLDKTPKYYDRELKQMVKGYPPIRETFGKAPMVMFDSMEPQYHHGVCREINSRKEWQEADRESGSATLSPNEWAKRPERREALKRKQERELAKDRRNASIAALNFSRENPRAFEEKLKKQAAEQEQGVKDIKLTSQIKETIKEELKCQKK